MLSCAPGAAAAPPAASPGALSSLPASVGGARCVPTLILALFSFENCFSKSALSLQGFVPLIAVSSPVEAASIIILPGCFNFSKCRAVPGSRLVCGSSTRCLRLFKPVCRILCLVFVKKQAHSGSTGSSGAETHALMLAMSPNSKKRKKIYRREGPDQAPAHCATFSAAEMGWGERSSLKRLIGLL